MALGWLLVLQKLPWVEVIANAPRVAEGARKLWNAVARPAPSQPEILSADPALSSDTQSLGALQARIAALETAASDLHHQMLTSSELIKSLAEHNTELVKAIETNRLLLLLTVVAVGLVGGISLILWFVR